MLTKQGRKAKPRSSRGNIKRAEQQSLVVVNPAKCLQEEGELRGEQRVAVPCAHHAEQAAMRMGEAAWSQGLLKPAADTNV